MPMRSPITDVHLWREIVRPEYAPLIEELKAFDSSVSALSRLRSRWSREIVAVAVEAVRARKKAARKFPDPARLWADQRGVEQATSHLVATHKANRFSDLGPARIWDFCSGIGGDAMALGEVAPVFACDRLPFRAWMTRQNAGCPAICIDVSTWDLHGEVVHLDPSRRDDPPFGGRGRRSWRFSDYRPPPRVVAAIVARNPDSAVKLGPGIAFSELPAGDAQEVEVIAERGRLVEAVLWSGRLALHPGRRTASRLPPGESFSARPGIPLPAGDGNWDRYLVLADPAAERADLLGALCRGQPVREVAPGLGLLTSPEVPQSAWLRSFAVVAVLPWRLRKVQAWLNAHDAGAVDVKTRGGVLDANAAQRQLRGAGTEPFTVFALRMGTRVVAVVTRHGRHSV